MVVRYGMGAEGPGRRLVPIGQAKVTSRERRAPTALKSTAKVSIAATIFFAATYGEGLIKIFALLALFLVYLMAVG